MVDERGVDQLYGTASEPAQRALREQVRNRPEIVARLEAAREAAERGEPPSNPVPLEELQTLIDDARRARSSGTG